MDWILPIQNLKSFLRTEMMFKWKNHISPIFYDNRNLIVISMFVFVVVCVHARVYAGVFYSMVS